MKADVKQIPNLLRTAKEILQVATDIVIGAKEAREDASKLRQEATREEQNSHQKLEDAKQKERWTKSAWKVAKAGVAAAKAALAAAIVAIPFSAAAVASARSAVSVAETTEKTTHAAYVAAQKYRELMEVRYKLAQATKIRADAMYARLIADIARYVPKIEHFSNQVSKRLGVAEADLENYQSHMLSPVRAISNMPSFRYRSDKDDKRTRMDETQYLQNEVNHQAFLVWRNYQTNNAVIYPSEIKERLNPSEKIRQGLLEHLYETDSHFREQVDNFRNKITLNEQAKMFVQKRCRQNMAGRLGEEIIKNGFAPFAGTVDTQTRQNLQDGGYTKIDIVLKGIKKPMVFGRGEGMGAREGGSVAIEVKAGQVNYLKNQEKHILRQVEGHNLYDVSIVVATRNFKELSNEADYRKEVREAGSRVLGMLPKKEEIDASVWYFLLHGVSGGKENVTTNTRC